MLLQLDVGNTRLKWRFVERAGEPSVRSGVLVRADFGSNQALFEGVLSQLALGERKAFDGRKALDEVQVASVAGAEFDGELARWFSATLGVRAAFAVVSESASGVVVGYDEPALLGVDRWLAVLAASAISNYQKVLVVDCGSAITIDILDSGVHRGGYIVPGMRLMVNALFKDTSQVKVAQLPAGSGPGRSTSEAVNNGVLLMAAAFVEGVCRRCCFGAEEQWLLLLTGGDAPLVSAALDVGVDQQLSEELVLDGLALSELVFKP
ncbi:MAG: type III pantothenate kinase [Cellvibrionaceae bacterium]